MCLLEILRWILFCGEDDQTTSYHSIRTSQPPPTYYSRYNSYDLEKSLSKPSSTSTSSVLSSKSKPPSSSHTSSKTFASESTHNSSLPSSNPSSSFLHPSNPFASNASQNHKSSLPSSNPSPSPLPSSKPSSSSSHSSSKLSSSNASPTHFSIPSSNASPTPNPSFPPSKLSTTSLTSLNPFPSSSDTSSNTFASNSTHNSSLPSSNPSSPFLHPSKPFASNASQNHKSSPPSSNPSPSPLPSSKPYSYSSHSSTKLSSSNASPTHFSIPSSNASPTPNPSLPPSTLSTTSLTSSNPFASKASRTHFSIPSSKPSSSSSYSNASPTQSGKNRCKDLEELIKEAIVSSVSNRPKSPSNASPRETRRFSSKLADQRYEIPKHLEEQIKKDIAPEVLRRPLSPFTYSDYFAALLYAEDFYIEKWSKFLLSGVTLELQRRETFETFSQGNKQNEKTLKDKKPFVAFEIENIPERRPYLLSRDFVFARRSSKTAEPFKGILFRVVKSTTVLVEFGDDFHSQHSSSNKYDVSFSFNRVCLKRSHQAISAAKDSSLHDVLFPNLNSTSSAIHLYRNYNHSQLSISNRILNHKGPLPYLIEGPLSRTETVLQEAILKIYATNPQCRILICSPTNLTCDALMRSLHKQIPKEKLFRANAAFRDYDLVPDDIIPQSLYKEECFACPSLSVLQTFSAITSTYVSSFRLGTAGLNVDHFTHIFLVDASSAMEPEVVVPLANFVGESIVIVVTGSSRNSPRWVRSDIARRYGLKRSYFQRLIEGEPYSSRNPVFITHVE